MYFNNPHYWSNCKFSKGHEKILVGLVCEKSTVMVMKKAFHCLEIINSLPLYLFPVNFLKVTECQILRSEKKKKASN